ncbi:MAG: lysophospholipid acyltransferase family protein [Alphaproteobacteria bacterium]|nr:lysophospholipid acyltransferase family protein [Alphaproteobacteria bacterium]
MKPLPEVTYAKPQDPLLRKAMIRGVEVLTGQPKLQRLYDDYKRTRSNDDDFWASAVSRLQLNVNYDQSRLSAIPKEGPVIVVANHPYGALDGIAMGYMVSRVRPDFKVLAHAVLDRCEPLRPYLIPVVFDGESSALRANVEAKKAAISHLRQGGCIVIFPAGRVSTADTIFGQAIDSPWKPFAGKLVTASNATVVPMFFEGQPHWLFHFVSKFSGGLREALVLHEVARHIGDEIRSHIGSPILPETFKQLPDRGALMDYLRATVYSLDPRASAAQPA